MSKYTINEKLKAIEFASKAQSIKQAARELDIPDSTLHDWIKEHKLLNISMPQLKDYKMEKELKKKDKQIKRLKEELEILKKFEAYSAKYRE